MDGVICSSLYVVFFPFPYIIYFATTTPLPCFRKKCTHKQDIVNVVLIHYYTYNNMLFPFRFFNHLAFRPFCLPRVHDDDRRASPRPQEAKSNREPPPAPSSTSTTCSRPEAAASHHSRTCRVCSSSFSWPDSVRRSTHGHNASRFLVSRLHRAASKTPGASSPPLAKNRFSPASCLRFRVIESTRASPLPKAG